ncbi:3'-5' exonuclease [Ceratobasidium sp. AG-Ba]|nr:3'-5' exonuclease [Ceratobasidium sp. AG-Ba]
MLPLLFAVCLLPFLATTALLISRRALASLRTRYGPLLPKSKHLPPFPRTSTMQRVVAFLLSATPTDPEPVVDTPPPVQETVIPPGIKQPLDYLLAFDVEATCVQGTDFNWPNEIIEWPVVLLKWSDKDTEGRARTLEVVDEFRSYVKPVWRPKLSDFCTALTGISQANIDCAPQFKTLLRRFQAFLAKHGLVDPRTGKPQKRFAFCTDGPFDVRDFCVKTAFINKLPMPEWLRQDVVDVRRIMHSYLSRTNEGKVYISRTQTLNMVAQLHALGMTFEGRQHCGMDDTRNIARILTELGKREVRIEQNTQIQPRKRWYWMGRDGEVKFDDAAYLNARAFNSSPYAPSASTPPSVAPSLTSSASSVHSSSTHTSRSTSPQRLSPHAPSYTYGADLLSRTKEDAPVWQAPASWRAAAAEWLPEETHEEGAVSVEAPARMESGPESSPSQPPQQAGPVNKPLFAPHVRGHARSRSSPANMTNLPQSLWSPVVVTGPIAIVAPPGAAPRAAASA